MNGPVIIDTGPLVALLNRREKAHASVASALSTLPAPFFTVEAVLTETLFLLRNISGSASKVLGLVRSGELRLPMRAADEAAKVEALMTRYADVPMSFADACLVRLVELTPQSRVLTLDSDFRVYRAHKSKTIAHVELD